MKVIIIGSGIVGATAAYYLSKNNVQVTLIDRNEPGRATDAAAGIICPWLAQRRNQAWYTLARKGARFYPKLIEDLTEDGEHQTGYYRVGAIQLHTVEKRLIAAEERVRKRKIEAPEIGEISLLDEQQTAELLPFLKSNLYQAIHISGAARIDGKSLRKALINAAVKRGTKLINTQDHLVKHNNQKIAVEADGETLTGDYIIATNGAWMKELFSPVGIDLLVHPQKAQIIHLETIIETESLPVIMPPNNQYILPFANQKVIIGATHETKAGFDERITAGGVLEILSKAIEIVPNFSEATLKDIKVGFRPFTPNSLPVLGKVPNYQNVLLANGLGASGLTTGPFIGKQLTNIILKQSIDINLSDYDVTQIIENNY